VIQLLILGVLLLIIPVLAGGIFLQIGNERGNLVFRWVSGQFLLWAGFQLISVPLILKERGFASLVVLFQVYIAVLLLLAAAQWIRRGAYRRWIEHFRFERRWKRPENIVFWGIFAGLLLFQLIQAVRLAYADGDDAYYVAISTVTQNAETMYLNIPYTGYATQLEIRHSLAPFPVWISFLARVSGMPAVMVAHVVLPVVLISMTYAIFYLLGARLFPEKGGQLPLFLIFTELLVIFGDYSFYTAENFMIARSRQGKAALGNLVIPFLLLLLLMVMKKLQEKQRVPARLYLLLVAVTTTGCLCSTLGALLLGLAMEIVGLLAAVCYRRPGCLLPLAACCIPCVCYAMLYLILAG